MRSQIENLILQIYLESSGLIDYLKNTNFDDNNLKNFIPNIVNSCSYLGVNEDKILIQNREKIEKYYILIGGSCKYYQQNKIPKSISFKEYYLYLIQLYRKGEISNIKNIIEENKDKVFFEFKDFDRIDHLLFLEELKYNLFKCRTKYCDIMKIFNDFYMNLHHFDIDNEELIQFNNCNNFEGLSKYCKLKLKDQFESEDYKEDLIKFKLNENINEKKKFILCETVELGNIATNTFFSEEFLTQNSKKDKDNNQINEEKESKSYRDDLENSSKLHSKANTNKKMAFSSEIENNNHSNSINLRDSPQNSILDIVLGDGVKNKKDPSKLFFKKNTNLSLNKISKLDDKKKYPSQSQRGDHTEDETSYCSISIICKSNCSFLVLNKEEFSDYLSQEKQKIKTKEIIYLTDNFFFSSINKKVFKKKFYERFNLKTYSSNNVLFKEKETPEKLFLIKEGIIEISLNKNIIELTSLIKDLIKLQPSLKNSIDSNSDYKANNQFKNIVDELTKKRKFTIFKYDSKDIVGMESFFLNYSYYYKATVISRKALIYEVDLNTVNNLKRESQEIRESFENICLEKLNSFLKRIIYLKNIYLRNFDNRLTEEQIKIKIDLNNRKNIEKITDIKNSNGVNILSKEVISLDDYNQIKDSLLQIGICKRRNGNEIAVNSISSDNNKLFNKFRKTVSEFSDEEENETKPSKKKVIVVNNNMNNKREEPAKIVLNNKSSENLFRRSKEFSAMNCTNQLLSIKKDQRNTNNIIPEENENAKRKRNNNLSLDSKSSNNGPNKNLNNYTDKKNEINESRIENSTKKKKLEKDTSKGNSNRNNDSQIESQNISIRDIEAKKKDFDVLVLGEKEIKEKGKLKINNFSRQNSDNNIDLIKYYNNYKSLRKASINFKMEEFFKEGIPLSTKAFENGSFFVTSNNSEEKIKWRKVEKKAKQNNQMKINLEEIDPGIDVEFSLNNIMLTCPVQTNESVDFVTPMSSFKPKRLDLPIIKKIKYEAEHKKNLENFILKKTKKEKLFDNKILPFFKSMEDKRIKISNFENQNFLGENNDYLLAKNSIKSDHIKEFYKMLQNKKIKGNKFRQQIFNNECL